MHGEIAAKRSVAVAAVAADPGHLDRALIELDVVGLVSVGCRIVTGDGNVDRGVDRHVDVDHASCEMAVAAVAGAVVAGRDDVGADQIEKGGENVRASARRGIAVPAVAADAGHLNGGLIEHNIICLISVSAGIVSRHRDVDGIVERKGRVNDAPISGSVATVAGAVLTRTDRARTAGCMRTASPPDAALPLPPLPPTPAIWVAD